VSLVLDASAAIASLLDDERTEAADRIMEQVSSTGAFVPSLWRLEVANVLRNAARRGRCTDPFVDLSLDGLARMPIAVDGETDAHAWGRTLELARDCDLTLYDAAYLELALRKALPLATCDDELAEAAKAKAVPLLIQ
jgi:predicted nucleic acid-binding protein